MGEARKRVDDVGIRWVVGISRYDIWDVGQCQGSEGRVFSSMLTEDFGNILPLWKVQSLEVQGAERWQRKEANE
jgi:hypothetical protein